MRAMVTNFGTARKMPTRIGDVSLNTGETKEIEGADLIRELSQFPGIGVQVIKERRTKKLPNFLKFKINELRMIASKKGIAGGYRMTKAALIENLKETLQCTNSPMS